VIGSEQSKAAGPLAALAAHAVEKRFGAVHAVAEFDLAVRPGEVHGLVGANGAGKSTLVKILSGALAPDSGHLRVGGWEGDALNPRLAQELGITTIYQEPDLVPTLAAPENIALGRERRRLGLLLDGRSELRDAHVVAERVGLKPHSLRRPVSELNRADQQLVEIAKGLHRKTSVLLMDEPTAPLGPTDIERLMRLIRALAGDGVAVVYISHRLPEVLGVCDRITVMRDGRRVWTRETRSLDEGLVVQAMIGHGVAHRRGEQKPAGELSVVLQVDGVSQGGRLHDISLTLGRGEVVGIAGLIGAGRSRLLRVIAGDLRPDHGRMRLRGADYRPHSPAQAIRAGVGLVPEDRKADGLFADLSLAKNIAFVRPPRRWRTFVGQRAEIRVARTWIERLRIVPPRARARMSSLSGGNQQKALLGRWLHADVDVLLVDEPGQGVDVHGKEEITNIVRDAARRGKAVLVSSSEPNELFTLTDRVLVMRQGRIVGEFDTSKLDEESLVSLASGATGGRA
jgi:ABC-type sugar transport system ATPase subunit